jgi:fucose 4-O-acetylase-like acetyltransferase
VRRGVLGALDGDPRQSSPLTNAFFVPIGQATLYVFILHVFVVLAVSNGVSFGYPLGHPHFRVNTLAHALALGVLWLAVKRQFLFRWIPRRAVGTLARQWRRLKLRW